MTAQEPLWPPEPLHVAVDVVVFAMVEGRLATLLWRRPYPPFEGHWALPGTFSRPDETLEESPRRALADKAGLGDVHMEQLATYDQPPRGEAPGRDPRGRVVSVAFLALARSTGGRPPQRDVRWWQLDSVPAPLGFDHERILGDALARLRAKARYSSLVFELVDEPFTLSDAQAVFEAVLGEDLDVRNFRRDLFTAGVIEEAGATRRQGPGRPAKLYRRTPRAFAVDAGERRLAHRIDRDHGTPAGGTRGRPGGAL